MARPTSFNKRDNEKNKIAKRKAKQQKKEDRKANGTKGTFDDMIAYVDENGQITDTPPDLQNKEDINLEDIDISIPRKADEPKDAILKGRVEYFDESKGYGFIKNLANTDKFFFHISNAPQNITQGNIVFFELEKGPKGINAVNISLTS